MTPERRSLALRRAALLEIAATPGGEPCIAKPRSGQPCESLGVPGTGRCPRHGGNRLDVLAGAALRKDPDAVLSYVLGGHVDPRGGFTAREGGGLWGSTS